MDENNTNTENTSTDSAARSPLSYDAPKENEYGNDKKPEVTESTSESTVSETAKTETTSAFTAGETAKTETTSAFTAGEPAKAETTSAFSTGEPAKTESTPSAFSVSESRSGSSSSSHTEVFGGQVEGTPTSNTYSTNNYSSDPEEFSKGFAIASLVMGILCILTCCCTPLSILFSILGIIFACVQKKDFEGNRPSQATAGLVLSIIGIVIVGLAIVISLVASGSSWYKEVMNSTL